MMAFNNLQVRLNAFFTSKAKMHQHYFKSARLLIAIMLSLAAVIALATQANVIQDGTIGNRVKAALPISGGQGILLLILTIWFYAALPKLQHFYLKKAWPSIGLGVVMSACLVLGRSLNKYGNLAFITSDTFYLILAIINLIGFVALLTPIFALALGWMERNEGKSQNAPLHSCWWKTFMQALLIIIVCWLPYIIIGFPGTTSVDFIQQLRQFYGATDITNHHPYVMTLFFGSLFQAGYLIGGSSNSGLFAVSCFQTIALACTFACSIAWLKKIGCNKKILLGITLFYGLCPIFPMFAQWCVKDTLSAALMVLFIMQVCLKLYYRSSTYSNAYFSWPAIIVIGVLCTLSRNNCAYVVIPTLISLSIVLKKKARIASLIATTLTTLIIISWSSLALPSLGIKSGSISEALSLPLLQTTRCIDLRFDSLTNAEKDSLQAPCSVSIEDLPKYYSIQISDQIKGRYSFEGSELSNYLKTYLSLGLRFPDIYTNVALAKTFGYWYPPATDEFTRFWYEYAPFTTSIMSPSLEADTVNDKVDLSKTVYEIHSIFPEVKADLRAIILDIANTPIGVLLFSAACYTWICLIMCTYQIAQKKPTLLVFVPIVLIFLICCISPLNGSIRYALPLACLAPLMVGITTSASCPSCQEIVSKDPLRNI